MKWWEAKEYDDTKPMYFTDRTGELRRPVACTTEPHMVQTKTGVLRLKLVNRHPHERVRIYVGSQKALRA